MHGFALLDSDDGRYQSLLFLTGPDKPCPEDGEFGGSESLLACEQVDEHTASRREIAKRFINEHVRRWVIENAHAFGSDRELMRALLIAGGPVNVRDVQRDDRGLIKTVVERAV
jgi:hypothetical protein